MASYFSAQMGAYGTTQVAIFALPNIKCYNKVTIIKAVDMGAKLDRDLWNTWNA